MACRPSATRRPTPAPTTIPAPSLRIPGATPGFIRQYFQAAVLEYHPGSAQPVKLGLIGDDVLNILYPHRNLQTHFDYREYRTLYSFAPARRLRVGAPYVPEGTSDRGVLIAFYQGTDGPTWTNSDNWLSDAPIGEWHGVTTDSDGRVVELNLPQNQLRGEIPPQLGRLTRLQSLELSGNQLHRINADLRFLKTLTRIDLSANPGVDLPQSLFLLTRLRVLNLANIRYSGSIWASLGDLPNLHVLDVSGNNFRGSIPSNLGRHGHLESLYVAGNMLTGCIPTTLRDVSHNDFDKLDLPYCDS